MVLKIFGLQKYNNFFIIQHLYKKILNFFENLSSEATCAHSEEFGGDPFPSHGLLPKVQIGVCLLKSGDTTGHFDAHFLAGILEMLPDGEHHHPESFRGGVHSDLSGRGLQKIGTGVNGQLRCTENVLRAL